MRRMLIVFGLVATVGCTPGPTAPSTAKDYVPYSPPVGACFIGTDPSCVHQVSSGCPSGYMCPR